MRIVYLIYITWGELMTSLSSRRLQVSAKPLRAVEEIRRMRGGCQSHLMRCSDGHYYVVKFPNNPQGKRVLANELLCTSLAELLSLPVAHGAVVFVSEELVRFSDDMRIQQGLGRTPCESGLCFGSRHVGTVRGKAVHDFLPSSVFTQVSNLRDFCGMLVFDIWTSNKDDRQVVFVPDESNSYHAVMIDQGSCFDGQAWQISDSHRRSLYLDKRVYKDVLGIEAFESWLNALAGINRDMLSQAAGGVPPQWFGGDRTGLARLLDQLYERKDQIRGKIQFFGSACPAVFPNWKGCAVHAGNAA
jgi:hypothetical protein